MNRPQLPNTTAGFTNFYHPEMTKYPQATGGVSLVPSNDWWNTHTMVDVDGVAQLTGTKEWLSHTAGRYNIPIVQRSTQ